MKKPDLVLFETTIPAVFAKIASRAYASVCRVGEGIYEINGQGFTVRVRCGTGHLKDILVTLLETRDKPNDTLDLSKEVGLGAVARFHCEDLPELLDRESYPEYAGAVAAQAERLLLPYLLGLRSDFSEIKDFVAKNSAEAVEQVSKYRFPKNVRKEWLYVTCVIGLVLHPHLLS